MEEKMEKEFIEALKKALEISDREIQWTDEFRAYPEWDSLSQLSLIAMCDENYNIVLTTKDLDGLVTVADLFARIKKHNS